MSDHYYDFPQPVRRPLKIAYGNNPTRFEPECDPCERMSQCCGAEELRGGDTGVCGKCFEHTGFECSIHEGNWDDPDAECEL